MKRAATNPIETGDARGGSGRMFDLIADRYDVLNRVLSLGLDQAWRRRTVAALDPIPGARVLDVATGTGDLALLLAERYAEVVGLDPSRGMIAVAERKVRSAALGHRVTFETGDAQALPFEAATFDAVTMAFGIRNVPDRRLALREARRVVRPGGRVAILELSEPREGVLRAFARFHVHAIVPRLGAALSGAHEYRYLERSIEAFPPPEEFASAMRGEGLDVLQMERMTFGAAWLFVATAALEEGH